MTKAAETAVSILNSINNSLEAIMQPKIEKSVRDEIITQIKKLASNYNLIMKHINGLDQEWITILKTLETKSPQEIIKIRREVLRQIEAIGDKYIK